MLLQGALATIKHSWEKVRLIAGLSKGDNSLFVPMVIIRSSGNSEMKDRLILRHKLTISVRFVPGQVCVDVTHSTYLAFQQGQPIGQWLPQANWGCNSCVQGEERTWQKVNSWALVTQTLNSLCVLRRCHSSTQEEPSWNFCFWAGSKLESSLVHSTEHEPLLRPGNLLAKTEVLVGLSILPSVYLLLWDTMNNQ